MTVLGLTGLVFVVVAGFLIYGTQVNQPPVAQLFGTIGAVLLGIAVLHFVTVRGIWSGARWAALIGIVISLVGTAIPAYIWFDQFTHSEDAVRVSAPYFATALLYAACLIALLSSSRAFNHK